MSYYFDILAPKIEEIVCGTKRPNEEESSSSINAAAKAKGSALKQGNIDTEALLKFKRSLIKRKIVDKKE